jgi:Mn-dependent DtxR family transcriptional regulator
MEKIDSKETNDEIDQIALELSKDLQNKASPRSKLMEAVLVLLLSRPLRTAEIASNLGYQTKYISSYLSYWKKKGLVYQEGGRWYLTTLGESIARDVLESFNNSKFKEMLVIARQILNEQVRHTKNNNTKEKINKRREELLSFFVNQTNNTAKKQQKTNFMDCIKELLEKLDSDEVEVLKILLQRYQQWGSTYLYIDQLEEEIKADSGWLFRVLRSLQSKKLIYLYHDPKLGLRIGLSQQLKQRLNC